MNAFADFATFSFWFDRVCCVSVRLFLVRNWCGGPLVLNEPHAIGATSGDQLTWAVFAPTTVRRAALAGTYAGATAGGPVGAGVGANLHSLRHQDTDRQVGCCQADGGPRRAASLLAARGAALRAWKCSC
nr:DUF992 domain-containing protein [Bradyrhizobium iriomotense]